MSSLISSFSPPRSLVQLVRKKRTLRFVVYSFLDRIMSKSSKPEWLIVSYRPVSLFSLKRSDATSMAGRSNFVPTPYGIKMALLKVLLEFEGHDNLNNFDSWIEGRFNWIRDLNIYINPPERLVVNRNAYKLRYYDQTGNKADKSRKTLALQAGHVFREWLFLEGNLNICCGPTGYLSELKYLFSLINYFGKRGSFFQYLPDATQEVFSPMFEPNIQQSFTIQPMDDVGSKAKFAAINTFSEQKAKLGKDRVIYTGYLPLKLLATNSGYDLYVNVNN